jgi:hypothetical protein
LAALAITLEGSPRRAGIVALFLASSRSGSGMALTAYRRDGAFAGPVVGGIESTPPDS